MCIIVQVIAVKKIKGQCESVCFVASWECICAKMA